MAEVPPEPPVVDEPAQIDLGTLQQAGVDVQNRLGNVPCHCLPLALSSLSLRAAAASAEGARLSEEAARVAACDPSRIEALVDIPAWYRLRLGTFQDPLEYSEWLEHVADDLEKINNACNQDPPVDADYARALLLEAFRAAANQRLGL